ncbi:MAG: S41 family peptidase [Chitinophagales bacterium]|jgi:hypothetical protein|nr:S41 family peptidase [Chitinophagales bacterium]
MYSWIPNFLLRNYPFSFLSGETYLENESLNTIDEVKQYLKKFNDPHLYVKDKELMNSVESFDSYFKSYEEILYLKISSFMKKVAVDLVLFDELFKKSKILVLDLRNNKGGSDAHFSFLLPYIFTSDSVIKIDAPFFLNTNENRINFIKNITSFGLEESTINHLKSYLESFENQKDKFIPFFEDRELKFEGFNDQLRQIYVLVNEKTGSSAESLVFLLSKIPYVTLVGDKTAGGFNLANLACVSLNETDSLYYPTTCMPEYANKDMIHEHNQGFKGDMSLEEFKSLFPNLNL